MLRGMRIMFFLAWEWIVFNWLESRIQRRSRGLSGAELPMKVIPAVTKGS